MLDLKENEPLAKHSTFRIGGNAKYFFTAHSTKEIIEAVDFAKKKKLPFRAIGGGSNLLFSDKGFDGVIIQIADASLLIEDLKITAGAGVPFGHLILQSIDAGLSGLEWGIGIPGTVGGGVVGNCGAYGHSMSETVFRVSVLKKDGKIIHYNNKECNFSYRESRFKSNSDEGIILSVEMFLVKGDLKKSREKIQEILENRKNKIVPYPSAGCTFKNVILDNLKKSDREKFLSLADADKIISGKFPTAFLIEKAGLKGIRVGGAMVAKEHSNFIVNAGGAKASDVLELVELCKKEVKKKFGIVLEEEITIV